MNNLILPDSSKEKTIFSGRLISRQQISKNDARTFFITLEFDHPTGYISGDSFAIYPENSQQDVLEFLQVLNLDPNTKLDSGITLFDYLKKKVALNKWTSKMSQVAFHEKEIPENVKDISPIKLLKSLNLSSKIALNFVLVLPPQMPRYYSIASSPKANPNRIDLLVSLNSFEVEGEIKYGLASSYLCLETELETLVHGFVHQAEHFRVPDDMRPIIMIGPGTGVAPFRAFIQERIHNRHDKNWLFFGERHRNSDFYFEDELLDYMHQNKLKLSLAFSRDQAQKVYVQNLMLDQKEELYSWLKNDAIIYVCGDAKNMAKDVEAALIAIISEFENVDPKTALLHLRALRKQKRYNLDVY